MLDLETRQKIGQILMCGFPSPTMDEYAKRLVDEFYIGNFVLFSRNIRDRASTTQLTSQLKQYTIDKLGKEPLISIDEECGMVRRLHGAATPFPGCLAVAATGDPSYAGRMGEMLGKELISAGINMDFAPDVDVNSNPNNPVIGMRSYGDNPEIVAEFGISMARGLRKSGVIPVYKHFPGHGDTAVDSHFGLPVVNHNMERLNRVELYPFKKAIENKADCILVSHLVFNAIEPENPATLSPEVIQFFLREHLGFEGVAVTDCMEMEAITRKYGVGEACVRAIQAGIDLVLISHTFEAQKTAVMAIYEAVENGRIRYERLDEAAERIENMKLRLLKLNAGVDYSPAVHMDFAGRLYEKSVTLAHGKLPAIDENDWICLGVRAFQGTPAEDQPANGLDFAGKVSKEIGCRGYAFEKDIQDDEIEELAAISASRKGVVLGIADAHRFTGQLKLYKKLYEAGKRIVVVSLRMPYDMIGANKPEAHLCTYEYTPMALSTVCRVLKGELEPTVRKPLKV